MSSVKIKESKIDFSRMTLNVVEYSWWGQPNSPPEQLKTRKQLSALELAPVAPVLDRLQSIAADNEPLSYPKRLLDMSVEVGVDLRKHK